MLNDKNSLETIDGLKLRSHQWLVEKPKAIICLVHGLGEHAGRYEHVANFLNDNDYSLMSYDLRGHGYSQGPKGHVRRYELLHNDIRSCIDSAKTQKSHEDLPLFLYGHSLGGLQVITYLLTRKASNVTAAIVTSPALRPAFTAPAWKLLLAKMSVKILPSLRVSNEIDVSHISRDKETVKNYQQDPLVHDRISASMGLNILSKGEWALTQATTLRRPMLLMHGSADKITSCEASKEFSDKAGDICQFKQWDGLFHETHNEPEKEQVLNEMLMWLNQNLATSKKVS